MNRTELINFLIEQRGYKRYLEICLSQEKHNFACINCSFKYQLEVDFANLTNSCDDFFIQNSGKFDIILIDGIHTEEQAIQDIRNAEQCLANGGVIVLHDCMPPDEWHQRGLEAYQPGENWNGTVWKAALRCFNTAKHKCTLLDTDWGCGIIDTAQIQNPVCREIPVTLDYNRHYAWLLEYKTSVAAYLRSKVKVYYHLACMGNWKQVFREQATTLKRHGFRKLNLTVLGTSEDLIYVQTNCETLKLEPQIIFHSSELTHFEKPAMLAIEEYARHHEGYVLYLHSKGVSNPTDKTKAKWRRLMMHELVEKWESCLPQLHRYDVIGVNWRDMPPVAHFCGNFWYASTRYLRTLVDFEYYYEHPRYKIWDAVQSKRLGCEFWIGSAQKKPQLLSLAYKNIDFCNQVFWSNRYASTVFFLKVPTSSKHSKTKTNLPTMKFRESELAHQYLDGLEGIEIGGSAHNAFGLNTKNVDYTASMDTVFKKSEIELCGEAMPVDIVANGDDLPLPDKSVDFVISSHVIEHFYDPIKALREWERVARKYIFIICPQPDALESDWGKPLTSFEELVERTQKPLPPEQDTHEHYSRWTAQTFIDLCDNLGLNVVEYEKQDSKAGNGFTIVIKLF